jgi:hypothetical protein
MVWHELHEMSGDCMLLVLARGKYLESDYIRDHGDFLAAVGTLPQA